MTTMSYTDRASVFAYGDVQATPSTAEGALMDALIVAVSRKLDLYCHQVFGQATYTDAALNTAIDRDGVLLAYPAVPTLAPPTAAAWRAGNQRDWTALDVGALEVDARDGGACVRAYGLPCGLRGNRVQLQLSFVGGWDVSAFPADLAWTARRLAWWEYKKRESPIEKTATPDLGQVVIPSRWPPDLREALILYVRSYSL